MSLKNNTIYIATIIFIIIKIFTLVIFLKQTEDDSIFYASFLSRSGGDTYSYVSPMKNYTCTGSYFVEKNDEKFYSIRPPHYMIIYFLLYKLRFTEENIFNLISILQFILSIISSVLLSILLYKTFKNRIIFYISIFFFALNSSISAFNHIILPESIALSFTSIAIFLLYRYKYNEKYRYLFFSVFLLSFSIQIRPYLVLSLFIPLIIIYKIYKFNIIKDYFKISRHLVVYFIPIFIVFAPWILRNYQVYHKIIPYEYRLLDYYYGYNYENSTTKYKRKLLSAVGESDVFWEKKSMSSFFEDNNSRFKKESEFKFKQYHFSKSIGMPEYQKAREMYLESNDKFFDEKDKNTNIYFENMTDTYRNEKWFNFYLLSPLKNIINMIFHKGTYHLPFTFENSNLLFKFWKYMEFLTYQFILFFSIIGFFIFLIKKNSLIFLSLIPFSIIFTTLLLKHFEYRYFALSYPVLIVYASYALYNILIKIQNYTRMNLH